MTSKQKSLSALQTLVYAFLKRLIRLISFFHCFSLSIEQQSFILNSPAMNEMGLDKSYRQFRGKRTAKKH